MRVGAWSGLDSLVRNVAYFFMIVRLLNLIGESAIGGYYLAMHIFWSFLLVPILALSESAKVLIANHSADIPRVRRLWYSSLIIGGIIVAVWIILLPLWQSFAAFLNQNTEIVEIDFLFWTISISRALVVLLVFIIGILVGAILKSIGERTKEKPTKTKP